MMAMFAELRWRSMDDRPNWKIDCEPGNYPRSFKTLPRAMTTTAPTAKGVG